MELFFGMNGQGDEVPFFLGRSCYGGRCGRGRSDSIGDEVTDFWGPKWQGAEVTLNHGDAARSGLL